MVMVTYGNHVCLDLLTKRRMLMVVFCDGELWRMIGANSNNQELGSGISEFLQSLTAYDIGYVSTMVIAHDLMVHVVHTTGIRNC